MLLTRASFSHKRGFFTALVLLQIGLNRMFARAINGLEVEVILRNQVRSRFKKIKPCFL